LRRQKREYGTNGNNETNEPYFTIYIISFVSFISFVPYFSSFIATAFAAIGTMLANWSRVNTHCPYCALQCGISVSAAGSGRAEPIIRGDENFPVNKGSLCIKGWTAGELLNHRERLTKPLRRNARGVFVEAEWDEAFEIIAQAIKAAQKRYGCAAVGVLGGGSLTNEKAYLLGKFARVALGTSNIDYNGRFCMSSAATAAIKAFGIDRGLPFPISDIAGAEAILLVGANPSETMPPLMQYFNEQRIGGGKLIVVDPRFSATARTADLYLRPIPGTDAALANGLLHLLIREDLIDEAYIDARTEGFNQVKAVAATYWPDRVERITGVSEAQLLLVARMMGHARTAMILTSRGAEQQSHGVNNTLSFINLALALGLPGRPFSGFGSITGQGNGQGGREQGQKSDQLPGYRRIDDIEARQHIADVWEVREEDIPYAGKSAYEMMRAFGGEIRALFSLGFNFTVSAPDAMRVIAGLSKMDFFCTADFFLSETARMADVVLPSAMWAEEEGTMTNLEGRVIRRRRAFAPPPSVREDLEIICELAGRLGKAKQFDFSSAEEVFTELRRASKGGIADYSGISYARLDAGQALHWPCPDEAHPGTPRLFAEAFARPNGRALFHTLRHPTAGATAEEPDLHFPFYLTTGRVQAHYQSGAQTRRVEKLNELVAQPCAELHPNTARFYQLSNGDSVRLVTRRGAASFKVKVTSAIREDTIFAPFHWGDGQSVNRLTNPVLDPLSGMPEFKVCAVRVEKE
jgi:assimilatory nitrate reductase catalytic subunit